MIRIIICLIIVLSFSILSHSSEDKLPECPALFYAITEMDIGDIELLLSYNADSNPSLEGCDLNAIYTAHQGILTYEDIDPSTTSLLGIAQHLSSHIYELLIEHGARQIDENKSLDITSRY